MYSTLLSLFSSRLLTTTLLKATLEDEETFMTPQPVGLTNLQSTIIGPYFTRCGEHCHPDVLGAQLPDSGIFCIDEATAHPKMLGPDAIPTTLIVAPSAAPDSDVARAVLESGEFTSFSALGDDYSYCAARKIIVPESFENEELRTAHNQLIRASFALIRTSRFGYVTERAISAALTGKECLWNAVLDLEKEAFNDDDELSDVCATLGISRSSLPHDPEAVFQAGRLSETHTRVQLLLLCRVLGRPIIMQFVETTHVEVFFPSDPQAMKRQPLVVFSDGSALVPIRTERSVPAALAAVQVTVFPAAAAPALETEALDNSKTPHAVVLPYVTAEIHEPSQVNLFEDSPCSQFINDDSTLSFASFPASYFALADDPAVAETLLGAKGYGKDLTGSVTYLGNVLKQVENLVPLNVDADGHCLLHSVSRCLVGKEYLWHALRTALHRFMLETKDEFCAIIEKIGGSPDYYPELLQRASPDFVGDKDQPLALARGLGLEHIFALCNVLRRPIVLFDNPECQNREGYLFLPLLIPPSECVTKKLLAIGWNDQAHIHFVPIVAVNGTKRAGFRAAALPHGHEQAGVLVYGVPENPLESLQEYTEYQDDSSFLEVGGETRMDLHPWCSEVAAHFERDVGGKTIWAVHEMSRFYVHSSDSKEKAIAQLSCIENVEDFIAQSGSFIKDLPLYACPVCTRTRSEKHCSDCLSPCRPFDYEKGWYMFKMKDRVPLRSTESLRCCVYKHWMDKTEFGTGDYVFARPLCSNFQRGQLVAFNETDSSYDIVFRDGSKRCRCPMKDIAAGFPCDVTPQPFSFHGKNYELIVDEDPAFASDPKNLAKQHVKETQLGEDRVSMFESMFSGNIERIKAAMKRRKRGVDTSSEDYEAKLNTYEPVYQDKTGKEIRWLWNAGTHMSPAYEEFEHEPSGKIEAAFQAGETATMVRIPSMNIILTIHFDTMVQENLQGFPRYIQRVAFAPWACDLCTFVNSGTRQWCEVCTQGVRPESAREVLAEHTTALGGFATSFESFEKARARADKDPKLLEGGSLFVAAQRKGLEDTISTFPRSYGSHNFYLDKTESPARFRILPDPIPRDHPVMPLLLTEGKKAMWGNILAIHFRGQYFFQNTEGEYETVA